MKKQPVNKLPQGEWHYLAFIVALGAVVFVSSLIVIVVFLKPYLGWK